MRVEDEIAFDQRMRELRRGLYALAGWLDGIGCPDSATQCTAVLNRLEIVRTTFAAERGSEADDDA